MLSLIKNRNFLPILFVVFFGVLAARSLIFESGYFNMHDDLQMMRQLELEKCFKDGQIPCRWAPDMGYGYGFPLFNFYPPLPYLVGEIFRLLGFTFVTTAKLTFASAIIFSGITMYLLAKTFFGRIGGILSAVFYVWAPYHAVDVYVRGAMNESWALVWFPLIFLAAYKLIRCNKTEVKKWVFWLSFSYACLFLSHNLMLLIFTPFFGLWSLIHLWRLNRWKRVPWLVFSGILALSLSAFFTIPALIENQFTQIKGQLVGYYDYTVHFVTIRQLLFSTFWGYGPSVWLEEDRMSFQVGYLHWILPIIALILLCIKIFKAKGTIVEKLRKDNVYLIVIFAFVMGWISAFMTHSKSTPIYLAIPQLGYLQFSWRFLTLVIFGFSLVIGYLPTLLHSKFRIFDFALTPLRASAASLLIILVIIVNWNYFKPEYGKMGPLTDNEKFSGLAWSLQQTAGIYDYLPIYAKEAPKEPMKVLAEVVGGKATIKETSQGTDWGKFNVHTESENATIRVNIFNFPGWKAYVDGAEKNIFVPEPEKWGRMWIDIPSGNHEVYLELTNTPVRTFSNMLSLFSFILMLFFLFWPTKSQLKKNSSQDDTI